MGSACMAEEKEIKIALFKNKDAKEIRTKLSHHLKLSNAVVQSDHYYDNADFLFTKRDRGLRIRYVGGIPVDFTCKALFYIPQRNPSPWYVEEHVFKLPTKERGAIREIFERFDLAFDQNNNLLTYADLDICLRKNNLSPKLIIEKKREIFMYEDAQVILDEVKNLGVFIEIETKTSSPMEIVKKLNLLQYGVRTIEGYTTLLSRKLGLVEMKQKEPLYIENPTWNVFPKEKEIYDALVRQIVK
jgi:adenylate cyclase class IV